MEAVENAISPIVKTFQRLGWTGFSRIVLDLGGLMLLVLALLGRGGLATGLRTPAFLVGVVALVDVLMLMEEALTVSGTLEGMAPFMSVGEDPQDLKVIMGAGPGRVYLEPRVPRVSGAGTQMLEIRGNPGAKVIYWPSGGAKLGAANDRMKIDSIRDMTQVRVKAMGCGVITLDERGRGIALVETGCDYLLYREVMSGKGGPIGKLMVGGKRIVEDGNRAPKFRS